MEICKCVLSWWYIEEQANSIMVILTQQILGILASYIKIERIFLIGKIFTTLWRYWFQIDNLDKLMFVNKNWPNDLCVGCLKLTNLASICEVECNLTKELDTKFVDVIECETFSNIHDTFWICFQICRCLKFIVFCYMVINQIYNSLYILGHIHNQGISFLPQDSRTLFLLSSKYKI
jgi:hypothetical protein